MLHSEDLLPDRMFWILQQQNRLTVFRRPLGFRQWLKSQQMWSHMTCHRVSPTDRQALVLVTDSELRSKTEITLVSTFRLFWLPFRIAGPRNLQLEVRIRNRATRHLKHRDQSRHLQFWSWSRKVRKGIHGIQQSEQRSSLARSWNL